MMPGHEFDPECPYCKENNMISNKDLGNGSAPELKAKLKMAHDNIEKLEAKIKHLVGLVRERERTVQSKYVDWVKPQLAKAEIQITLLSAGIEKANIEILKLETKNRELDRKFTLAALKLEALDAAERKTPQDIKQEYPGAVGGELG
jgi:hypothetical protein